MSGGFIPRASDNSAGWELVVVGSGSGGGSSLKLEGWGIVTEEAAVISELRIDLRIGDFLVCEGIALIIASSVGGDTSQNHQDDGKEQRKQGEDL